MRAQTGRSLTRCAWVFRMRCDARRTGFRFGDRCVDPSMRMRSGLSRLGLARRTRTVAVRSDLARHSRTFYLDRFGRRRSAIVMTMTHRVRLQSVLCSLSVSHLSPQSSINACPASTATLTLLVGRAATPRRKKRRCNSACTDVGERVVGQVNDFY